MNIVPHILPLVRIIVYAKTSASSFVQNGAGRSDDGNHKRTLQNQSELLLAITNTIAEPTIRPPKDIPRDIRNTMYESERVYGSSLEFEGGSVVQKAAIVVRSNPACSISEWRGFEWRTSSYE